MVSLIEIVTICRCIVPLLSRMGMTCCDTSENPTDSSSCQSAPTGGGISNGTFNGIQNNTVNNDQRKGEVMIDGTACIGGAQILGGSQIHGGVAGRDMVKKVGGDVHGGM
jgi:hypothetical protein